MSQLEYRKWIWGIGVRGRRAAGEEAKVGSGAENLGLVCSFKQAAHFQAQVTVCDVVRTS